MYLAMLALVLCSVTKTTGVPALSWPALTMQECVRLFPRADTFQPLAIRENRYVWKVWHLGLDDDLDEFLGNLVLGRVEADTEAIETLVGIDRAGSITKVDVRGPAAISEEFLAQFEGKSALSSFSIARTPEDLLFVPAKIKAMAGRLEISEKIASEVLESLKASRALAKK